MPWETLKAFNEITTIAVLWTYSTWGVIISWGPHVAIWTWGMAKWTITDRPPISNALFTNLIRWAFCASLNTTFYASLNYGIKKESFPTHITRSPLLIGALVTILDRALRIQREEKLEIAGSQQDIVEHI